MTVPRHSVRRERDTPCQRVRHLSRTLVAQHRPVRRQRPGALCLGTLEVDQRAVGEPAALLERRGGVRHEACGERRVEEHDVEGNRRGGPEPAQGVGLDQPHAVAQAERVDRLPQRGSTTAPVGAAPAAPRPRSVVPWPRTLDVTQRPIEEYLVATGGAL